MSNVIRCKRERVWLVKASSHLDYEVRALQDAAKCLALEGRTQEQTNAYIESFWVHARNVYDFLFAKGPREADVVAGDFAAPGRLWHPPQPPSEELRRARHSANKAVSHLSWDRVSCSLGSDLDDFAGILRELQNGLKEFFKNVDPQLLTKECQAMAEELRKQT